MNGKLRIVSQCRHHRLTRSTIQNETESEQASVNIFQSRAKRSFLGPQTDEPRTKLVDTSFGATESADKADRQPERYSSNFR